MLSLQKQLLFCNSYIHRVLLFSFTLLLICTSSTISIVAQSTTVAEPSLTPAVESIQTVNPQPPIQPVQVPPPQPNPVISDPVATTPPAENTPVVTEPIVISQPLPTPHPQVEEVIATPQNPIQNTPVPASSKPEIPATNVLELVNVDATPISINQSTTEAPIILQVDNNPQPFNLNKILINEFSVKDTTQTPLKEWVELFNNSGSLIDLKSWYLTDDSGTKGNITTANTQIYDVDGSTLFGLVVPVGGFAVYTRGNGWLNDTPPASGYESVSLFNSAKELVDKVTVNASKYPTNGQSVARITDGLETWENRETQAYTKGKTNNLPEPQPVSELNQGYITAEQLAGNPNGNLSQFDGYCGATTSDQSVTVASSSAASINMRFTANSTAEFYRITEYKLNKLVTPNTLQQARSTYLFYPNNPSKSTFPVNYSSYSSAGFYGINGYAATEGAFVWYVEGVNSVGVVTSRSNLDVTQACTISYEKPTVSDLQISVISSSNSVKIGNTIHHNIEAKNLGPNTAYAVVVTYKFQSAVRIQSVLLNGMAINPIITAKDGYWEISIPVEELKNNELANIDITILANTVASGIYNQQFSVTANELDSNTANNVVSNTVEILQNPKPIALAKPALPSNLLQRRSYPTRKVIYRVVTRSSLLVRTGGAGVAPF